MKKLIDEDHNGLLPRRSFIAAGATFLTATMVGKVAQANTGSKDTIGKELPKTMMGQADDDVRYGMPSPYEKEVRRAYSKPRKAAHTPLQDLRGIITPNGLHFGIHHSGVPEIDPSQHELKIHGMVKTPLKFSMKNILRYPIVSKINFLECSGNGWRNALKPDPVQASVQMLQGAVSGSEWTGVPLKLLLEEVGVKTKGKWLIAEGADPGGHARSIPMERAMDDAILALYQNGERIRPSQGYPMRLFVPGWEGNACVKWLHRIEVTDQPIFTQSESVSNSEPLPDGKIGRLSYFMEVKSLITHPSGEQQLPDTGFYEISGLAWSGRGRIKTVEVSVDNGKNWVKADLDSLVLDKALTRFTIPWHWRGKATTIMSRATDDQGNVQPTRSEWKKGFASFNYGHYNAVQVWNISNTGKVSNVYL